MEARRELICKGYLRKSPPEIKIEKNYKWRKRYFKLWSDKTLEYYKNEYEPRPLKEPLDLCSCMALLPCDEKFKKYIRKDYIWMFSLPMPGRCYHFAARTEGEMITWKREISKMCNFMEELRDGEATVDEVDVLSDVELPRTTSASSQHSSQHSTSSASSKSSPHQWRVNGNGIDTSAVAATPQYRTSSVSSNQDRVSYRSPDMNGRLSSVSPVISPSRRSQTPRSPESPRPKLSTGSPFPAVDMAGNYDVLRSPVRAVFDETPEAHYDILPPTNSSEAHYDVPPPTSRLQHLSYKGRSVSLKQSSTSVKASTEPGYVDMKPKEDDYLEYENDNNETEKVEKKFLSPPWMNNTRSLKERSNVLKGAVPRRTNTISLDNGFHHQSVVLNDPIHDEIPEVMNKTVKEVVTTKGPPKVDRGKKPAPKVNRRKKPSLQNSCSFDGSFDEMDNQQDSVACNGMSPLTKGLNNTNINKHSPEHSSFDNYLNNPIIALHNDINSNNNYDNLPSPIRCDANGKKLTIGTPAQINLQLDYAWEPLPPKPSDNEPSSPASPYENSNEVFRSLCEEETHYKNLDSLSEEEKAASLTYSEVRTSNWTTRRPCQAESSSDEATIGEPTGETGTHYVFVDIPKSNGLKLSKRSMEIGLAD